MLCSVTVRGAGLPRAESRGVCSLLLVSTPVSLVALENLDNPSLSLEGRHALILLAEDGHIKSVVLKIN